MAPTKPPAKPISSPKPSNNPSSTPTQPLGPIHITTDQVQQLLDILKQGQGTSNSGMEASPSEEKDDKIKSRIRASKPDIKKVYQIWNKSTYKFEIKESFQTSSDEDDKYLEYIGVFRERFDTREELEGSSVDIKSTALRDILREVLKGVTCVSLREDKPSIDPDVLFTYLPQLEEYHRKNAKSGPLSTNRCFQHAESVTGAVQYQALEGDLGTNRYFQHAESVIGVVQSQALETNDPCPRGEMLHLETLIKFLKMHYASKSEKLNALLEHKEITFELLAVFFRPNSIVYMVSGNSEKPRCLRFDYGQVKKSNEAPVTAEIQEFQGVMKITSLGVYPLEYHAEKQRVVEELTKRGQKFMSLNGTHYREYKGQAFYRKKKEVQKFAVRGRVMIDAASFREKNPNYFFPDIDEKPFEDDPDSSQDDDSNPEDRSSVDRAVTKRKGFCSPDELLLCSETVYGFCFISKLWAELSVDDVGEITWDSSAFHSLVISQERKEIVQALVERHTSSNATNGIQFRDIIQGKGRSLVILLHGPPGVGKTLTAEGIAEMKELPLYNVCAGDLGTNAELLERNLVETTSLAHKWGAIVLIDEADVYLEERSLKDVQRNGLVSVFLRHLEYFQGIMFLTTNRVTTFDDAFRSRITFAMKFDDLSIKAKKKIWETFLQKVPTKKVSDKDIDGLSHKNINGRQIRNVVKTGWDFASWKGECLEVRHLETAIRASEAFEVDYKGAGAIENLNSYR